MASSRGWVRFLWLWLFMLVVYVLAKTAFNLILFGWIDLRTATLLEALVLPSIQSLLLWFAFRLDRPRQ